MGLERPEKLIGVGCDGANVNISDDGFRRKLEIERPWLIITRCMAYRLELAIKDEGYNTVPRN